MRTVMGGMALTASHRNSVSSRPRRFSHRWISQFGNDFPPPMLRQDHVEGLETVRFCSFRQRFLKRRLRTESPKGLRQILPFQPMCLPPQNEELFPDRRSERLPDAECSKPRDRFVEEEFLKNIRSSNPACRAILTPRKPAHSTAPDLAGRAGNFPSTHRPIPDRAFSSFRPTCLEPIKRLFADRKMCCVDHARWVPLKAHPIYTVSVVA